MLIYVLAGLAAGVVYTLSPLVVWFAAAACVLIAVSGRGLDADERRRVQIVLAVAIGVRVLAVAGLFLATDHARVPFGSFFGDEEYFLRRSMWLRNVALGIPIHSADLVYAFQEYSDTSHLYALGFLQTLVGFAPYGAHLVGIALYTGTAIILFRLVRPTFGAAPALVGLVLMLWLPSLFAWSISALKEPLYFALTAIAIVAAVAVVRGTGWARRIAAAAIVVAASYALQTVRPGALAIEAASVLGGLAFAWIIVRPRVLIGAVIASILAGAVALSRPDVQVFAASGVVSSAVYHRGHIWTAGRTYKVLDDRLYDENVEMHSLRLDEASRFIVRALVSYATVPLPNQIYSTAALAFLPEQMVWYLLVALAPIGLVFALRRDVLVASLLLAHAAVAAVLIAFSSGNIGTLVRHRGFALPYLIWISAVGACELLARSAPAGRIRQAWLS